MKAYIVKKTGGCHSNVSTKGLCYHRPKVGEKLVLCDLENKIVLKSGELASVEKVEGDRTIFVCKTKHGSTYEVSKLDLHNPTK